jgi:hypothetical protein
LSRDAAAGTDVRREPDINSDRSKCKPVDESEGRKKMSTEFQTLVGDGQYPYAALNKDQDVMETSIYYRLFEEAERVRWKMSDIPWESIEREKAPRPVIELARVAAFFELTTWSATNMFFQTFTDDMDFSQWITVWLYEETKHPQALMRWLKLMGESFDVGFMTQGRKAHPFVDSKVSTLTLNILSEIQASALYIGVSNVADEPVLKGIAKRLAADEARHASGFYSYAKKYIENSEQPDVERWQALRVLYFWLADNRKVKHPVAMLSHAIIDREEFAGFIPYLGFESEALPARMRQMVGTLIGRPLNSDREVTETLREFYGATRNRRN